MKYFPSDINISDGKLYSETSGFLSNNLTTAWNQAELYAENEWEALMVWVLYQSLHKKAKEIFIFGKHILKTREMIDIRILEDLYLEALHVSGYENMLKEYRTSNN